jgi:hypothetical protein
LRPLTQPTRRGLRVRPRSIVEAPRNKLRESPIVKENICFYSLANPSKKRGMRSLFNSRGLHIECGIDLEFFRRPHIENTGNPRLGFNLFEDFFDFIVA